MLKRLDRLADIFYGRSPSRVVDVEGSIPVYGTGGIYAHATRPQYQGPAIIVPRKGSLGKPHLALGPFWASDTTYAVIPKTDVDAHWLFYQLDLFELERLNEATGVPSISREWLSKITFSDHGPAEQQKCASMIRAVDAQIQATEKLIAKQEKVRAGLIQDLFTRGVDEKGHLRPAREEAAHLYRETILGWLPKAWKPWPLGELTSLITSGSRDWAKYYSVDGALFVRIGNLTRAHVNLRLEEKIHVTPPGSREGQRTSLKARDVLISITADLGIIGLIPEDFGEAYINQHIALVRLADPTLATFIANFLGCAAGQFQFRRMNDSGAKAGLNLPTVQRTMVPIPAEYEAQRIGEIITSTDTQIATLNGSKRKLEKQRAGLMRDLLNGAEMASNAERDHAA